MTHPNPLAFKAKEQTINGITYKVEPLGFTTGRKAFVRLSNLLGPALASLDTSKASNEQAAKDAFFGAIGMFLSTLKDEDLAYFEGLYAPRTIVVMPDGKEPLLKDCLETLFVGERFGDYFAWLGFAIWGTYGDFFTVGLSKLGDLLPSPGKVKASG